MRSELAKRFGVHLRDHYRSQYESESDYAGYRLVNQTSRTERWLYAIIWSTRARYRGRHETISRTRGLPIARDRRPNCAKRKRTTRQTT